MEGYMKIGIIIYSITGNTKTVAQALLKNLVDRGFDCTLLEVKSKSNDPNQTHVEIIERPTIQAFDKLIFATPVHAFSPSKVMKTYLSEIEDLNQKDVTLFITHHFPFAWMGGNSALKQIKRLIEKKNGKVNNMFSINWSSKKRSQNIQTLLDQAIL